LPPVVVLTAALLAAPPVDGHDIITSRFDYHNDVLPILERHCIHCHAERGSGPFSLATYEEARPRAVAIKEQVLLETMPPWFAETGPLELDDKSRLTAREIDILMEWASGGAPIGKKPLIDVAVATARDAPTSPPPPSLVVPIPEIVLPPGESRAERRVTLGPELTGNSHLHAWRLSSSRPDIIRGVDVYRGRGTNAGGFLGSRLATDPRLVYRADTTASLGFDVALTLVIVAVRPDDIGRVDARASAKLELWLVDEPGEREVRGTPIVSGTAKLPPEGVLLGVRPRAGFRLRDSSGSSLIEIRAAPVAWPRTYVLRQPFAMDDTIRIDVRNNAKDLGLWLVSFPRTP
jgi:hypothetical protein